MKKNANSSDHHLLKRLGNPPVGILWIPGLGILSFLILYAIAALVYPGGSWIHPAKAGFDFWNNYLCDLLDEYALNGSLNTARFYARAALFVLCAGLLLLWFYLPKLFDKSTLNHFTMWLSGIIALGVIFFMGTNNHDLIVRIAGVFGIIAIISCSVALLKDGYVGLGVLGLICLVIFLFNYYIYETGVYLKTLPWFQKVTFVICLSWFFSLNYSLYLKMKASSGQAEPLKEHW